MFTEAVDSFADLLSDVIVGNVVYVKQIGINVERPKIHVALYFDLDSRGNLDAYVDTLGIYFGGFINQRQFGTNIPQPYVVIELHSECYASLDGQLAALLMLEQIYTLEAFNITQFYDSPSTRLAVVIGNSEKATATAHIWSQSMRTLRISTVAPKGTLVRIDDSAFLQHRSYGESVKALQRWLRFFKKSHGHQTTPITFVAPILLDDDLFEQLDSVVCEFSMANGFKWSLASPFHLSEEEDEALASGLAVTI